MPNVFGDDNGGVFGQPSAVGSPPLAGVPKDKVDGIVGKSPSQSQGGITYLLKVTGALITDTDGQVLDPFGAFSTSGWPANQWFALSGTISTPRSVTLQSDPASLNRTMLRLINGFAGVGYGLPFANQAITVKNSAGTTLLTLSASMAAEFLFNSGTGLYEYDRSYNVG